METVMSWGAEEWQGAKMARCEWGEEGEGGFAEPALLRYWLSPLQRKPL